jgi:DNA mismatch repair ATPase MutS
VQRLLADAGHLDMLAAVALAKRTCFARMGTALRLKDLYHPALSAGERVLNSIEMDPAAAATPDVSGGTAAAKRSHVLLTGPNRGGKSTFLKALGAAILLNQTVGVVFARRAELPVFGSIVTALTPTDRLGEMSLFEAEIEFAKGVRETIRSATQPVFLMMDEIFHGTNAHDGVEASQVFLDELYGAAPGVFSIVSTHYMDLPARYGEKQTQNLCMDASVDPADPDRLVYTYRLCPGVNRFSSVREILRERGLLSDPCGSPAQKTSAPAAE